MSERRSIRVPVPTEDGAEIALMLPHALTVDERDRIKQIVDAWVVNPAGEEQNDG